MATKAIDTPTQEFIRSAAGWPTVRQIAEEWNVPERFVRSTIERRKVSAIRLDFVRVNPRSWEQFMKATYRPGQF